MSEAYGTFQNPQTTGASGDGKVPAAPSFNEQISGSYNSPLQPFQFSDNRMRLLQFSICLLVFLAWVGCCIVFGSPLHSCDADYYSGPTHHQFSVAYYWNKVRWTVDGSTLDSNLGEFCGSEANCEAGGRGLVALATFAFLCLTVELVLSILRFGGKYYIVPKIGYHLFKYLYVELVLVSISCIFYFCMAVTWGSACFRTAKECHPLFRLSFPKATGYAYVCVCLFFLLGSFGLLYALRQAEESLGLSSSGPGTSHASLLPSSSAHADSFAVAASVSASPASVVGGGGGGAAAPSSSTSSTTSSSSSAPADTSDKIV